jgi:hypothetical protein
MRNAGTPTHIHDQAAASPFSSGAMPSSRVFGEVTMSAAEYRRKLDELDRLLNDPDVPMQPDRIWSLLADVARPALPPFARQAPCEPPER